MRREPERDRGGIDKEIGEEREWNRVRKTQRGYRTGQKGGRKDGWRTQTSKKHENI